MLKTLSDKRKYECQQRQNEYSKGHQVFKIKMFHQHHPPTQLNPYLIEWEKGKKSRIAEQKTSLYSNYRRRAYFYD